MIRIFYHIQLVVFNFHNLNITVLYRIEHNQTFSIGEYKNFIVTIRDRV